MANPAFELVDVDEHHATATAFNMVFAFWHKETQLNAFLRVCDKLVELAATYREGVGVCQVVGLLAIPPTAETRDEITKLMKLSVDGHLKHYSIVHEGTGFKAASVRAIVSASQMMARSKTSLAVFSTVAEAATWHADQQRIIGRSEQPRQISEVITRLRDSHSEHAEKGRVSALGR